jgi:hypothetical protein
MSTERFFNVMIRCETQNDGAVALRKGSMPVVDYLTPVEAAAAGAGYARIRKLLEEALKELDEKEKRC